jgi:hypothetical protein
LLLSLPVLFLFLHLKRPVVVFAVAEYGLHVIQGILVKASSINNASDTAIPRAGDFGIFLLAYALVLVLGVILLDEIIELVNLGTEAGSTIAALLGGIVFLICKDLFQPSLLVCGIVLVSVATFEAFEL